MDSTNKRVRSALVWVIMACLCGLIGFIIVYHYATNVRPIERFAIIVDAGSTQTRSNLFRLIIEADDFIGLADEIEMEESPRRVMPVGRLLKIQQIGGCVNGGPLASIPNQTAANNLIRKCLIQFANQIQLLNFVETTDSESLEATNELAGDTASLDADDVSDQLALMNHRVNSITHLHLGATAGMRALEQLNSTRAEEKLNWIEQSIRDSNQMLNDSAPYINTGFVGILKGSDEASFGWVSVNFVCDALVASAPQASLPEPESVLLGRGNGNSSENNALVYRVNTVQSSLNSNNNDNNNIHKNELDRHFKLPHSIGTLELGGASAQLAFQVANKVGDSLIRNMSLKEDRLQLFNGHYKLATRSDLCLGMSQAVLRLNYVLLHKTLIAIIREQSGEPDHLRVTNVCLQRGSSVKIKGSELAKIWRGACLTPNDRLPLEVIMEDDAIRALATSMEHIEFLGTGQVDECNSLLDSIVQPELCKRYFSLCPDSRLTSSPPSNMPFVTISGYNHALRVLNLTPANQTQESPLEGTVNHHWIALNQAIEDKLGGRSIEYEQFVQRTRDYCSTNVSELTKHYPKVTKQYQNIICLQLVYIGKLLVEFYQLHPLTSWQQIKFLIFEPKRISTQFTQLHQTNNYTPNTTEIRPDIGWTLGLLLNATSQQLESGGRNDLYHHHGASAMYVVRTTILLVVACSLIAIAFLVIGVVQVREMTDETGSPIPSRSSRSSSTYNIGNLGYTITQPANYKSINSTSDFQKVNHSSQRHAT
uniref:Ectonucleoside triphosphate diphosphohydrolase 1 n=1 Tax=Aceria tosichella TaxID=561515 RepID=A0A6G1SDJ9_9ACAR